MPAEQVVRAPQEFRNRCKSASVGGRAASAREALSEVMKDLAEGCKGFVRDVNPLEAAGESERAVLD